MGGGLRDANALPITQIASHCRSVGAQPFSIAVGSMAGPSLSMTTNQSPVESQMPSLDRAGQRPPVPTRGSVRRKPVMGQLPDAIRRSHRLEISSSTKTGISRMNVCWSGIAE